MRSHHRAQATRLANWVLVAYVGLVMAVPTVDAAQSPRAATAPGQDIIATVAGGGSPPPTSVPAYPLTIARFGSTIYMPDLNTSRVVALSESTNTETIVAGMLGQSSDPRRGDGGPALSAQLFNIAQITTDKLGNLFIADKGFDRVMELPVASGTYFGQSMVGGNIYSVAGGNPCCNSGYSGDGGPATTALLNQPHGLATDPSGNLFISDGNMVIREVAAVSSEPPLGQTAAPHMTVGDIYTVGGDGSSNINTDGSLATAGGEGAGILVTDATGSLYFPEQSSDRVREIAAVTGTNFGQSMSAGHIYTVAGNGATGVPTDGTPAGSASLDDVSGVTFDAAGNLLIGASAHLYEVPRAGGTHFGIAMDANAIYIVAGNGDASNCSDGVRATSSCITGGFSGTPVVTDGAGNLFEGGSFVLREVAEATSSQFGQAMTANFIYRVAGTGGTNPTFYGNGAPATAASLVYPVGVAVDASGDIFIPDQTAGLVLEVPSRSGSQFGQSMAAGNLYMVAGGGAGALGDGGPATSATIKGPSGVAVDSAGDLFIADSGNYRVREMPAASGVHFGQSMLVGNIYTVAGTCCGSGVLGDGALATSAELTPTAVYVDRMGNLLIADGWSNRIREVAAVGETQFGQTMTPDFIYTVAGGGNSLGDGGPATAGQLSFPGGVAVDGFGDLLIADRNNVRVREVAAVSGRHYGQTMITGRIYTVAGNGSAVYSGDGIIATAAQVVPAGVAVDSAGDILIADGYNNRVREVAAVAGQQFGATMTVGDIYTIAGTGVQGFTGDGGAASAAELSALGVGIDGAGNVYVADGVNSRVREVGATASGPPVAFQVTVPAFTPGTAVNVSVVAKNAAGSTATGYRGTVHFSSTDLAAVLPVDYTFTSADSGAHTFAVTFHAGSETLTVTDTASALLNGKATNGAAVDSTLAGVAGGDNALYAKRDSQSYQALGGGLLAAPAVTSVPDVAGTPSPLYVGLGGDHRLYVRSTQAAWRDLMPGQPVGCYDNPAATVTPASGGGYTLTVVCQGGDHALYYWQTSIVATALPSIATGASPLGGAVLAGPAVASVDGVLTFFAEGTNHVIYSRTLSSAYSSVNAECVGHPAAASFGADAYLACQGLDGSLYYSKNTAGTGWSAFKGAGGQLIDGPGIAVTSKGATVFVEGADQQLYHTVVGLDGASASGYTGDGGIIQHGAGATGLHSS